MSTILPFFPEPDDFDLGFDPTGLLPIRCEEWCVTGDGHPDAIHPAEQRCRSVAHRLDAVFGGGRDGDQDPTSVAAITIQADQIPGQPAEIILGAELDASEQWIRLTVPEARAVADYLQHLVADVTYL